MSVQKNDNPTASVSHTEKRDKKKRWFYFNTKSCIAMAVSAALLFTSVDSMAVRAEELGDMVPPAVEEESPEDQGNQEVSEESFYLKNEQGAVIITSFKDLPEEDSRIELMGRKPLEEVRELMPKTLTANVTLVSSTSEDNGEPEEGEKQPDEGEKPEEGEKQPDEGEKPEEGEKQPDEGEKPEEGEKQPDEGEKPGEGEKQPDEGEKSGEDETNPGAGEEQSGEGDSGEADSPSGLEDANDVVSAVKSGTFAQDGQRWRLLVETGESGSEPAGSETGSADDAVGDDNGGAGSGGEGDSTDGEGSGGEGDSTGGEGSGSEGDSTGGEESGNGGNEDGTGSGIEDGDSDDTVSPETVEVEVPVTWECENYDTEKLAVYTFVPKWDEKEWFFEESEEHKIPTIEVVYTMPASEVSTEEELAAAFAAGYEKIVLKNDIALTKPLTLPADANIELDGDGYKLTRGKTAAEGEESGSSETFLGIMINMNGEDYTEDTYGTLTLKNITVDGGTETDCAGTPAILNWGSLIMDEGAVIKDNFNYGTYPKEEDGETILDYGGGIQVHRELTLSADALVTENFADELGGGVYLAGGATLYLYADVIVNNSVGEGHGYGADLYAAPGSTIYYDPSIDMEREGFYICQGVILIPMGDVEATLFSPEDADSIEVFVSVNKNSGYSDAEVEALKQALRDKGYTVLEGRSEIDATDLRNWYVYDHYDTNTNCWGPYTTGEVPAKWSEFYQESGNKRKYYPYTEGLAYGGNDQVYTIEEWLDIIANPSDARHRRYTWQSEYTGVNGEDVIVDGLYLARFKTHIVSNSQAGGAEMTFVGYGITPNIDFLYYDPKSDGEKVVDFDVDSSQIDTHTLRGNGFLVNTGVEGDKLYGYLILYTYTNTFTTVVDASYTIDDDGNQVPVEGSVITGVKGYAVRLYQLNGVPVDDFHNGVTTNTDAILGGSLAPLIVSKRITNWDDMMSVQIMATPNKIEVWQQPKSNTEDIRNSAAILTYEIPDASQGSNGNHYSGFGPLVAYDSHNCRNATTFTYSNLRMYFTNPMLEQADILSPLEKADFTQKKTQKYFINLLGNAQDEEGEKIGYAESANFGQYQEYMEMMQHEGIALITDRKTPFGPYLGEANEPDSNLFELETEELLSPQALADWIAESIKEKHYTDLEGKGLSKPNPVQSVGNIWLESAASGDQIRELDGTSFGRKGYEIQIRDDLTYYFGDKADIEVTYEVFKPGELNPTLIGTASPDNPLKFVITASAQDWPTGQYTVRQTVSNSSICGYSYFDLKQAAEPPVYPPVYPVKVKVAVKKDNVEWNEHGKKFMLRPKDGGDLIDLSESVSEGNYFVYDVTGLEEGASPTEDMNTGILVEVEDAEASDTIKEVALNYYTVTFYDENSADKQPCEGDTVLNPQIVLKDQCAARPDFIPTKNKYVFVGWVTADGTEFDFDSGINQPTEVYAKWEKIEAPRYKVTINVRKDGGEWKDSGRIFALRLQEAAEDDDEVEETVYDLERVKKGTYRVYDISGAARSRVADTVVGVKVEDGDTGVTITVKDENETAAVDYYTVTFYDGKKAYGTDVSQRPMVVLSGKKASEPPAPGKKGYRFTGWKTEAGGSTAFNFEQAITSKTDIYAGWKAVRSEPGKEDEEDISGGDDSEDMQTIAVRQEASPQAGTSQAESEPKTEDATPIEIYATGAMIAGLTYMLLYFMEEGRGMTEREKEVFVAAFIRWAKKGGRFRRYCALVAIFCILVYYHSIGKRSGKKVSREYLRHAL